MKSISLAGRWLRSISIGKGLPAQSEIAAHDCAVEPECDTSTPSSRCGADGKAGWLAAVVVLVVAVDPGTHRKGTSPAKKKK